MKLIPSLFWGLALIHLIPMTAVVMPSQIAKLYGVIPDDKTQIVLLQHRAFLLGLVGAACALAAHNEAVRWLVLIGTSISMCVFVLICLVHNQMGGPLRKIAFVDLAALPIAATLFYLLYKG